MERKWLEEKTAKEALEAKVKSLKKKVKELKEEREASGAPKTKEIDNMPTETVTESNMRSRGESLDETSNSPGKPAAKNSGAENVMSSNVSADNEQIPSTSQEEVASVPPHSASSSESKESSGSAATKVTSHRRPIETVVQQAAAQKTTIESMSAPDESIRRQSSGDAVVKDVKSLQTKRPAHVVTEPTAGSINEKLSPPRSRSLKDSTGDKVDAGKSPATRSSIQSLVIPTIDAPSGHVATKPVVSSNDSLGSTSDFDPLRNVPVHISTDSAMTTGSDPVAQRHQSTLSSRNSVASFFTAPLPTQSIEFDPLSASHPSGATVGNVVYGVHPASSDVQPIRQHGYSQSMPNFNMMMSFPVQQVHSALPQQMQQQSWNQTQQPGMGAGQNQYLPSQYTGPNAMGMNPQQMYPGTQAVTQPQQQQQHVATSGTASDPFDELASRRAPPGK